VTETDIPSPDPDSSWQLRDIAVDADQHVWQYTAAGPEDLPMWRRGMADTVREVIDATAPAQPLTLLVRAGRPVVGVLPPSSDAIGSDGFTLGEADEFLGRKAQPASAESGAYAWCVGAYPNSKVLYLGEAINVLKRTNDELRSGLNCAAALDDGWHPFEAGGCALATVLARHPDAFVLMWPVPGAKWKRVGVQTALIRRSAIRGSTPAAQGGGFDSHRPRHGTRALSSRVAQYLLYRWSADQLRAGSE
jgi:hypothetical protein